MMKKIFLILIGIFFYSTNAFSSGGFGANGCGSSISTPCGAVVSNGFNVTPPWVAPAATTVGESTNLTITSGSAVTLASTTTATIGTLALTPGYWMIGGTVSYTFASTTSVTNLSQGWSTTSHTLGTQGTYTDQENAAMIPTNTNDDTLVIPNGWLLISQNTNVMLVSQGTFTASSLKAYGTLWATRWR